MLKATPSGDRISPVTHEATRPPTRLQRAKKAYGVVGDILTPGRIMVLLTAIALAITGLVGGWDAAIATESDVPIIEAGEATAVAPFEITVKGMRHTDELPGVLYASDEYRYLVLVADVTNTSSAPVDYGKLARAATIDAEGLPSTSSGSALHPDIYRINDSLTARTFQPGVVTPSVLVWQQAKAEPVPDEVDVTLHGFIWRYSIVEESENWFDEAPVATLTLPVTPLAES